ncbi:hypothetical protein [Cecembia lonarensis]|uniref:Uncharacterized protein n=1 Tax=Cecembia lonarensis (strain CCUG 58316 / KCTC 22772 / LW9) TaxID=1225176 RepID=K1KUP2_CECL9|nr:hypothetical protein [Cecembia lonarensis]EKB47895.1 hypothetical protein B879_03483 [Cecembia lonarensis LW9]
METIDELKNRWNAPTPPFFKKLRNIGLMVAGVGAALMTAPVTLPAILVQVAGYLVTAGAVITSISQITLPHEPEEE